MFLHVLGAKPLDGYRVEVCFNDGREGIAENQWTPGGTSDNLILRFSWRISDGADTLCY